MVFGRNKSTAFKALKNKAQVVILGQTVAVDELETDNPELGFS